MHVCCPCWPGCRQTCFPADCATRCLDISYEAPHADGALSTRVYGLKVLHLLRRSARQAGGGRLDGPRRAHGQQGTRWWPHCNLHRTGCGAHAACTCTDLTRTGMLAPHKRSSAQLISFTQHHDQSASPPPEACMSARQPLLQVAEAAARRADVAEALGSSQQWPDWAAKVLRPRNERDNVMHWACGRPSASDMHTTTEEAAGVLVRSAPVAWTACPAWRPCKSADGVRSAGCIAPHLTCAPPQRRSLACW